MVQGFCVYFKYRKPLDGSDEDMRWLSRSWHRFSTGISDYWRWLRFSVAHAFFTFGNWLRVTVADYWHWVCFSVNFRLFLQGLPAIVVGLGCAIVLGFAAFTPAQEVAAIYIERAQGSARSKNFLEADMCYERLSQLKGDSPELIFEWALMARDAGQIERCRLLMNQLAPPNKVGYGKVHFWLGAICCWLPIRTHRDSLLPRRICYVHWMLESTTRNSSISRSAKCTWRNSRRGSQGRQVVSEFGRQDEARSSFASHGALCQAGRRRRLKKRR